MAAVETRSITPAGSETLKLTPESAENLKYQIRQSAQYIYAPKYVQRDIDGFSPEEVAELVKIWTPWIPGKEDSIERTLEESLIDIRVKQGVACRISPPSG